MTVTIDTDTMTVLIAGVAPVVDGEWEAYSCPSGWDLQRYDDEDGWQFATLTRGCDSWVVVPGHRDDAQVRPSWRVAAS